MSKIKNITFALFCLIMVVLAVVSLLDNLTGEPGTSEVVYHSVPFAVMWGVLAVLAFVYIFRRKLWKVPATFLIHAAFGVILAGALVTHIWGVQGKMHLRENLSSNYFVEEDGLVNHLPFAVHLERFEIEYYPGSNAPKDYVSRLIFKKDGTEEAATISMNNIASYCHYRFYQSGYDDDLQGSILIVTKDPWGIGLTYTGYLLLLLLFEQRLELPKLYLCQIQPYQIYHQQPPKQKTTYCARPSQF